MKYPEHTGSLDYEPWSVRQSAIYHGRSRVLQQETIILVSPTKKSKAETTILEWAKQHPKSRYLSGYVANKLLWTSYLDNWRPYMSHYEEKLQDLVRHPCNHCYFTLLTINGSQPIC